MKTFNQILNGMAGWIVTNCTKLTNFFVGSVLRTLLEAIAMEIEALYFQMHKGFIYAIENSIFHSFGFYKKPAISATGEVTVVFKDSLPQSFTFLKGFKFATVPILSQVVYFEVTEDTTAPKGCSSILVPVSCTEKGVVGNVPSNTITIMVTPVNIVRSVYNEKSFGSGTSEESSSERKRRFTTYIQTLSKATVDALKYAYIS